MSCSHPKTLILSLIDRFAPATCARPAAPPPAAHARRLITGPGTTFGRRYTIVYAFVTVQNPALV